MSGAVVAATGCVFGGSGHPDGGPGWADAVPEEDGLYAYNGEELVRLDGGVEWEKKTWGTRSNLPRDVGLVIRDPGLDGSSAQAVGLRKVAWVRSTVSESGEVTPVTGSMWQPTPLPSLAVPLEAVGTHDTERGIVWLKARRPLGSGLYSLYVDTGKNVRKARFGVAWPQTDKQAYAASVCVDRYVGQETGYRRCGEQSAASGDPGLQIYLVEPETRTAGSGRSLVISGVILNKSDQPRSVPLLAAELRDNRGQALTRWRFKAASGELEPGESTSFRTEVNQTPRLAHSINVDFAPGQASNQEDTTNAQN
ncbi:MAG TPA: hypothetical protein VK973_18225 [Arenicellales bacterium]|nr:hypothetical protein [Arenicellales bacterium]